MRSSLSLRYLLQLVFDNIKLIAITLVVVNLGTVLYNVFVPRTYVASSKIYIERASDQVRIGQGARPFADPPSVDELLSTEAELIKSYRVLQMSTQAEVSDKTSDRVVDDLRERINIIPVNKSNVLRIELAANTPTKAVRELNEIVKSYIAYRDTFDYSNDNVVKIDIKLQRCSVVADSIVHELFALYADPLWVGSDNSIARMQGELSDAQIHLKNLENKKRVDQIVIDQLSSALDQYRLESVNSVSYPNESDYVKQLRDDLLGRLSELREVELNYNEESQEYEVAKLKLGGSEEKFLDYLHGDLANKLLLQENLQADIASLSRQVNELKYRVEQQAALKLSEQELKHSLSEVKQQKAELDKLKMVAEFSGSSYADVAVSLISPATAPANSKYPNVFQNLVLGLLTSIFLSVVLISILEGVNDRVKYVEDVESLGIVHISSIPRSKEV